MLAAVWCARVLVRVCRDASSSWTTILVFTPPDMLEARDHSIALSFPLSESIKSPRLQTPVVSPRSLDRPHSDPSHPLATCIASALAPHSPAAAHEALSVRRTP